jgi:hypothetical protein
VVGYSGASRDDPPLNLSKSSASARRGLEQDPASVTLRRRLAAIKGGLRALYRTFELPGAETRWAQRVNAATEPREAYGVRGACSRFQTTSALRQRQQAGRSIRFAWQFALKNPPSLSRSSRGTHNRVRPYLIRLKNSRQAVGGNHRPHQGDLPRFRDVSLALL